MIRFDLKGYSRRLSKSNQIVYYVFSEHNIHLWIGVTQQPNKLFYDAIICQKSVIENNKLIDC